jgi:hypothetical protein
LNERQNPPKSLDELVAAVSTAAVKRMPWYRNNPTELIWEVDSRESPRTFSLKGVPFFDEGFAAINQGSAMSQLRKQGIITQYDVQPRPLSDYRK